MPTQLLLPPPALRQQYDEVVSCTERKGRQYNLHLLKDVSFIPPFTQVTSVSVVPVIQPGRIIATILQRGPDIPGGHIETSDHSFLQALEREAYEEACIVLAQPIYLIGVIASDYRVDGSEHETYMLTVAARVERMDDFNAAFESLGRQEMTNDQFLGQYRAGPPAMMQELVSRAHSLSNVLF